MVCTSFSRHRISSMLVEARSDSFLHILNNILIFHFYLVKVGASALSKLVFVENIRDERHFRRGYSQRLNIIDGKAPRIKVEHHVRENEKIITSDLLSEIRRLFGEIKRKIVIFRKSDL